MTVGDEYGTGMIRVTLTAVPCRSVVLAAKAAVVAGLVLAAGVVLGLLYLFPIIAQLVSPHWYRHLEQVGPMTARLTIQGHHRAARPADQPVGRPRGGRRLGCRGAAGGSPAPAAA
jgi:hypothetical protein